MSRRILCAMLSFVLLAGLCSGLTPVRADWLSPSEVEARFLSAESIWPDGSVYTDGWDDGCSTCYGFVRELFRHLFGTALPTMWSTADARFANHPEAAVEVAHVDYYSVEQLSSMLTLAQPGDVFIATTGGRNHGVIVRSVAADGSGIYVFDANWHKNSAGQPLIRTNGWWSAQEIKRSWPGAATLYRDAGQNAGGGYGNAGAAGGSIVAGGYTVDPSSPAVTLPGGQQGAYVAPSADPGDLVDASGAAAAASSGIAAPAFVSSDRHVYSSKESIPFSWQRVNGAQGYSVTLLRGSQMVFSSVMGTVSFTSAPLEAGDYSLVVQTVSTLGAISEGAVYSFTVTDQAPDEIYGFCSNKPYYTIGEQIVLNWEEAHGAEQYRVFLQCENGSVYYMDTTSIPQTVSGLPEGNYTMTLRAYNHAGSSESGMIYIAVGESLEPAPGAQTFVLSPSDMIILLDEEEVPAQNLPTGSPAVENGQGTVDVHFQRSQSYTQDLFIDVSDFAWYAGSVSEAYELGLMEGNGFGIFEPDGRITLAQAITIASRIHATYYQGSQPAHRHGVVRELPGLCAGQRHHRRELPPGQYRRDRGHQGPIRRHPLPVAAHRGAVRHQRHSGQCHSRCLHQRPLRRGNLHPLPCRRPHRG